MDILSSDVTQLTRIVQKQSRQIIEISSLVGDICDIIFQVDAKESSLYHTNI